MLSDGIPVSANAQADIYALGIVLYQLLNGLLPFPLCDGKTTSVLTKMLEDRAGPMPRLRPTVADVSASAEAIVRKCLAPDPADRYATAADLRDDLLRQRTSQPLAIRILVEAPT